MVTSTTTTTSCEKANKKQPSRIFLKQVEYGWRKLAVDAQSTICVVSDKWPYCNEENKQVRVDHGWLLRDENEIQFHFFGNPLLLWLPSTTTVMASVPGAVNEDNSTVVGASPARKLAIDIKPWTVNKELSELKDFVMQKMVHKKCFQTGP